MSPSTTQRSDDLVGSTMPTSPAAAGVGVEACDAAGDVVTAGVPVGPAGGSPGPHPAMAMEAATSATNTLAFIGTLLASCWDREGRIASGAKSSQAGVCPVNRTQG